MTKRTVSILLALLLAGIFSLARARQPQQQQQPQLSHTFLKVGDMAPDFTLRSDQGTMVKLSDYRGKKNVILAFYVLAFTGG
jgi:cytochrome oxidase Cu insertion factor (SCO1/SenC/PrrC family)